MWRFGWLLALAWACNGGPSYPGDQLVGTYHFAATPVSGSCPYSDVPSGGFSFDATLSRDSASGNTWVTINSVTRDAGFNGQTSVSTLTAPRRFVECDGGDTQVTETLSFAVLSQSQFAAAGKQCPARPLDGGVPAPDDAGVLLPGLRGGAWDAVRGCGELVDALVPDNPDTNKCISCTLTYAVDGTRK